MSIASTVLVTPLVVLAASTGDADPQARHAVDAVRRMGAAGAPALPALRALLAARLDTQIGDLASAAIASIEVDAEAAAAIPDEASGPDVDALIGELRGGSVVGAAMALRDAGPAAAPAVPDLLDVLAAQWGDVRASGVRVRLIEALGAIRADEEQVVPVLLRHLEDKPMVAMAAAVALAGFPTGRDAAVAHFRVQREGAGYWDPSRAIPALGKAATPEAVALLSADAREAPGRERIAAGATLGRIACVAPELREAALIPVVEQLHGTGWNAPHRHAVQEAAAGALEDSARAGAGVAVQALGSALAREDHRVRLLALEALARIGPLAEPAVPAVRAALESGRLETPAERLAAVVALGRIGPGASACGQLLLSLLSDAALRDSAGWALARAAPDYHGATDALRALLADDSSRLSRLGELAVIAQFDAWGRTSAGAPDPFEMRMDIRAAVAHRALPALLAELDAHRWRPSIPLEEQIESLHGGEDFRSSPTEVVSVIRHAGPEAIPPLLDRLRSPEPQVAAQAALALGLLDPPVAVAIPHLVQLLGDERCGEPAAWALANLGPAALPALIEVLERAARDA